MTERQTVTIRQACAIAQVSASTIRRWVRMGQLPHTRAFNGAIRIYVDALMDPDVTPPPLRPTQTEPVLTGGFWPPTVAQVLARAAKAASDLRTPEDRNRQQIEALLRWERLPKTEKNRSLIRTAEKYGLKIQDLHVYETRTYRRKIA